MAQGNERKPKVTVAYKPLVSSTQKRAGKQPVSPSPYLRAENEDDDGYDPYSDRREEPPLFERNPWD